MKSNVVREKSFGFAVKIVFVIKQIHEKKKEFVLSKQFLRSGTSIGANIRESDNAESKADFIHKFSIAQKECDETIYWLELLNTTGYWEESDFTNLTNDAKELLRIIRSILLSSKQNIKLNSTHNS